MNFLNPLPPLLLMLALGATPLQAQSTPDAQAEPSTKATDQNTGAAQSPQTADTKESTVTPAPKTSRNDSPFDYRSSEEISEDLSVSFPVDI